MGKATYPHNCLHLLDRKVLCQLIFSVEVHQQDLLNSSDKKTLLLYGYPDVQWKVRTQPADKKTPVVGMEFSTDMVQEKDWLSRIAACCDAWLVRGTTFLGARNGFVKAERIQLFHMMNDLPDIREVVTKTVAQKEVHDNNITTKSKSNTTRGQSVWSLSGGGGERFVTAMNGGCAQHNDLMVVDDVYNDFVLLAARPDPITEEQLYLYGFPDEHWVVKERAESLPAELPEPMGIKFSRDEMEEDDWLSHVAVLSYSWLLSVSKYFVARSAGFNKADRMRLFDMINDLPAIHEIVSGTAKKQVKRIKLAPNPDNSDTTFFPPITGGGSFAEKSGVSVNRRQTRGDKGKEQEAPSTSYWRPPLDNSFRRFSSVLLEDFIVLVPYFTTSTSLHILAFVMDHVTYYSQNLEIVTQGGVGSSSSAAQIAALTPQALPLVNTIHIFDSDMNKSDTIRAYSEYLYSLSVFSISSSFFSADVPTFRDRCHIQGGIRIRALGLQKRACYFLPNDACFYKFALEHGLRFLMDDHLRELLVALDLALVQVPPNMWNYLIGFILIFRAILARSHEIFVDEFLSLFQCKDGGAFKASKDGSTAPLTTKEVEKEEEDVGLQRRRSKQLLGGSNKAIPLSILPICQVPFLSPYSKPLMINPERASRKKRALQRGLQAAKRSKTSGGSFAPPLQPLTPTIKHGVDEKRAFSSYM
ncbi:hypothetical protein LguiA_012805 [Lonicera macranthoides]